MIVPLSASPDNREYAQFTQSLYNPEVKTILLLSPYEWYPPVMDGLGSQKFLEKIKNSTKRKDLTVESVIGLHPSAVTPLDSHFMTMHHWPTFWLSYFYYSYPIKNTVPTSTNDKLFIALNGKPYDHRCVTMEVMSRYGLLEKPIQLIAATGTLKYGFASWNNLDTKFKFKYWTQDLYKLDTNFGKDEYLTKIPEQFNQAFMNLVSESSMTTSQITEKTAKPLMLAKPFLTIAPVGYHTVLLKDLGFELYDEVFDYSFDTVQDSSTRIEEVVKMLKPMLHFKKAELDNLHAKLKDKLAHNRQRFLELATDLQYWPKILVDQLESNPNSVLDNNIVKMYRHFKSI